MRPGLCSFRPACCALSLTTQGLWRLCGSAALWIEVGPEDSGERSESGRRDEQRDSSGL